MRDERKINLIVLGESSVGKSSIIKRIKDGTFQTDILSTCNFEVNIIQRNYKKYNIIISLIFHDTPGVEQFQNIIPKHYLSESQIILLVFSDINTLNELKHRWNKFYKKY